MPSARPTCICLPRFTEAKDQMEYRGEAKDTRSISKSSPPSSASIPTKRYNESVYEALYLHTVHVQVCVQIEREWEIGSQPPKRDERQPEKIRWGENKSQRGFQQEGRDLGRRTWVSVGRSIVQRQGLSPCTGQPVRLWRAFCRSRRCCL